MTMRTSRSAAGNPLRGLLHAAVVAAVAAGFTAPALADLVTCESEDRNRAFCRTDTRGGVHLQTQLSQASCHKRSSWGYNDRGIWVANGCRAVFRVGSDSYRDDHHGHHEDNQAAAAVAGVALLAIGALALHESHEDRREQRHGEDHYDYRPSDEDWDYYRGHVERHRPVTCKSDNFGYSYCRAPVGQAYVRLTRRLSKSDCEFHEDWGYNRSGIWVDNGCSARFEIQ